MNNEYPAPELNVGCSSEETNTSTSSRENKFQKSHVVNFKESKTHLFYVIESDNESNEKTRRLIRIKISKERPTSKKFVTQKMSSRFGNNEYVTDENQDWAKRTPRRNLTSIHKRTDHPSFLVLPEVFSKSRGGVNVRKTIERNQSTSENSNETYVIRSKNENKIFASYSKEPRLLGASLWKINSQKVDAPLHRVVDPASAGDYCECDKGAAGKVTNKSSRDLLNKNNVETTASATNPSPAYLIKDDLFDIHFVQPTQENASQRLRAGQDRDRRYQSCHVCPNMKRIFPPTSSRRRTAFQSHYSDSGSNSSLKNRGGYVKINYKLVRQCLICGSANEKCELLDAIRLRMKSPDFNLAIRTIEDIIQFDLFGVQCECRSKPLLEELFWPINVKESHQLQSSIAQFINALVSYQMGRNYFSNRSIIRMLTWGDIGRDNIDPIVADNLIGIMMKLSCSRFQRTDMLKNGLMRWLLQRMEDDEYSASKYHLQCMAGLLRNLLRGYNLDEFSPTDMRKIFILLGRYLNTESVTAKRYIRDCLITLFQSITNVASAKELSFKRVIEEHVTRAVNSKQEEHLRAVYQLLNRSATSKPFNSQKFASLSEEDPFLDVDLESENNEEIDYYPGECLLRDKYSDDAATHHDEKNLKSKPTADDTRIDGKLISRVFVEHLNCLLPDIDKNRIFPLHNTRCADKIQTCSHIGDIQPKKRQPYIPPNLRTLRLPRRKQSIDDSVDGVSSTSSGKQLRSDEQLIRNISTISHDKSAAKWQHFEDSDDDSQSSTKGGTTAESTMKRIFLGPSMQPGGVSERKDFSGTSGSIKKGRVDTEFPIDAEGESVIRSVSYHHDSSEKADMLNDRTKLGQTEGTANSKDFVTRDDNQEVTSGNEKKLKGQDSGSSIRKSNQSPVKSESTQPTMTSNKKKQPQENISENATLHKETKFSAKKDLKTDKGEHRLSRGGSDSIIQQSRTEISKQTKTGENETGRGVLDRSATSDTLLSSRLKSTQPTIASQKTKQSQENISDNTNLHKDSKFSPTKDLETHKIVDSKKGSHRLSITQQSKTEISKETNMGENKTGRKKSEEVTSNLGRGEEKSHKTEATKTIQKSLVEEEISREKAAENAPAIKGTTKENPFTEADRLHARSAEMLKYSKKVKISPATKSQTEIVNEADQTDLKETSQKLHARSTEGFSGGKTTRKKTLTDSQAPEKSQTQKIEQPKLSARSDNVLEKISPASTSKEKPGNEVAKLHARSAEALDHSEKGQKLSPRAATKSKPEVVVSDAQKVAETSEMDPNAKWFTEAVSEVTTANLHARSAETVELPKRVQQDKDLAKSPEKSSTTKEGDQPLLNVRSENVLRKMSPTGTVKDSEALTTANLHAWSAETVELPKRVQQDKNLAKSPEKSSTTKEGNQPMLNPMFDQKTF